MIRSRVAKRYARALFELAHADNKLDALTADLNLLEHSFNNVAEFRRFIESPVVPNREKTAMLEKLFKQRLHPLSFSLLNLLVDKNRETEILSIVAECRTMMDQNAGIVRGTVYSVVPLQATQLTSLKKKLDQITSKDLHFVTETDSGLIGGVVVKVGDRIYDSSLKNQLGKLKESLIQS